MYTFISMKNLIRQMAAVLVFTVLVSGMYCCCFKSIAEGSSVSSVAPSCHQSSPSAKPVHPERKQCECHREISIMPQQHFSISGVPVPLKEQSDVMRFDSAPFYDEFLSFCDSRTLANQNPPYLSYSSLILSQKNSVLRI